MRVVIFLLLLATFFSPALGEAAPTCQNPKLDFSPEQRVTLNTFVKWHPSNCAMVIETWRNGTGCIKVGVTDDHGWDPNQPRPCTEGLQDVGVRSGKLTIEQIRGHQRGRIEIKIWVPNTGICKSVFVNVQ